MKVSTLLSESLSKHITLLSDKLTPNRNVKGLRDKGALASQSVGSHWTRPISAQTQNETLPEGSYLGGFSSNRAQPVKSMQTWNQGRT